MKTKNTRYLDAQGRIILPNHIRKDLNLKAGSAVDVELEVDGTIRIRPSEERCAFCGEAAKDKYLVGPTATIICGNCAAAIAATVKKEAGING